MTPLHKHMLRDPDGKDKMKALMAAIADYYNFCRLEGEATIKQAVVEINKLTEEAIIDEENQIKDIA